MSKPWDKLLKPLPVTKVFQPGSFRLSRKPLAATVTLFEIQPDTAELYATVDIGLDCRTLYLSEIRALAEFLTELADDLEARRA